LNPFKKAAMDIKTKAEAEAINTLQMLPTWQHKKPAWTDWSISRAIREGYNASVWVYACVEKIAEAACSVPWHVQKRIDEDEWGRDEGHPLEHLLDNPVQALPLLSGRTLFQILTQHLYLGGNGLWHVVLSGGYPVELWPLLPDRIKPVPTKDGLIDHYEYTIEGQPQPIPPENIAHFLFPDPANMYWGISKMKAAAKIVDTDLEAINWNKSAMQNRAISDGVFTFKGVMTKEQWEEAREQVRLQHQGADNARTPWVLGADAAWQQMSMSPAEMDFINSRKFNMYEIHAVFGVDPLLTGAPDHSGRANKTEAKREFWQDTIIPYLDKLQDGINNTIVLPFDPGRRKGKKPQLRVVYDVANVEALQESFHLKTQSAERLYRMGVPFNNINRRLEMGFDEIPGGDRPYGIPTGMQLPEETAGSRPVTGRKSQWTEEEKTFRWKAMDREITAWERRIVPDVEEMFSREGDAVVDLFEKTGSEAEVLRAIDEWTFEWEGLLLSAYPRVIQHFGSSGYREIENLVKNINPSRSKDFDITKATITRWIRQNAATKCTIISEYTKNVIRGIIETGIRDDLSNPQIAKLIKDKYEWWKVPDPQMRSYRSMRIARTETHSAAGFGHHQGAVSAMDDLGVETEKTWISSRDPRVRDLHEIMDGETMPLTELYSNGLMYPGDPQGATEEVIHCRCGEIYQFRR